MLSSNDINIVKFSKAVGGYKAEEVDIFLDKVVADYIQYERIVKDFQEKVEKLTDEVNEFKSSQERIQNVLLQSQQLADKIINDAKEKSNEIIRNAESNIAAITQKERELSASFELKAKQSKAKLEEEMQKIVLNAKNKADSMIAAANDTVAQQQILFDKLKMEIAAFKTSINAKYKEHLTILSSIPDTVPTDPKRIAEIVSTAIDKTPDPENYINKNDINAGSHYDDNIDIIEKPDKIESDEDFTDGFKIADFTNSDEEE